MIKKFTEYIRESLNIGDSFQFSDNIQALVDSWEDKVDFEAYKSGTHNYLTFKINLYSKSNFNTVRKSIKELYEFIEDLSVIIESLEVDNIKYKFDIEFGDNGNPYVILGFEIYEASTIAGILVSIEEQYSISVLAFRSKKTNIPNGINKFVLNNWIDIETSQVDEYKNIMLSFIVNDRKEGDKIKKLISTSVANTHKILDSQIERMFEDIHLKIILKRND